MAKNKLNLFLFWFGKWKVYLYNIDVTTKQKHYGKDQEKTKVR